MKGGGGHSSPWQPIATRKMGNSDAWGECSRNGSRHARHPLGLRGYGAGAIREATSGPSVRVRRGAPLALGLAEAAHDGHDVLVARHPGIVFEAVEGQGGGGGAHGKAASATRAAAAILGCLRGHRSAVGAVRQRRRARRPNGGATQVVPLRAPQDISGDQRRRPMQESRKGEGKEPACGMS